MPAWLYDGYLCIVLCLLLWPRIGLVWCRSEEARGRSVLWWRGGCCAPAVKRQLASVSAVNCTSGGRLWVSPRPWACTVVGRAVGCGDCAETKAGCVYYEQGRGLCGCAAAAAWWRFSWQRCVCVLLRGLLPWAFGDGRTGGGDRRRRPAAAGGGARGLPLLLAPRGGACVCARVIAVVVISCVIIAIVFVAHEPGWGCWLVGRLLDNPFAWCERIELLCSEYQAVAPPNASSTQGCGTCGRRHLHAGLAGVLCVAGLAGCRGAADDEKTHSGAALGLPWRVARAAAVLYSQAGRAGGTPGRSAPPAGDQGSQRAFVDFGKHLAWAAEP